MKSISRLVAVCLFLLASSAASAQIDSLLFETNHSLDSAARGDLRLNVRALCFFHDNEYKGSLVKGYTLPGYNLRPTLSYQPLKNLRMEAGLYMLHYWGANKYPNLNYSDIPVWKGEQTQSGFHLLPFFNVQLALRHNVNIVLGNIYGGSNHHLIQPLYNKENNMTADPEMGVQILWDSKPVDLDVWVNWESFIFNKDTHQEAFTFGLSTRFKANSPNKPTHVYFPLQVLMQHRGGEINPDAEERSVKTWANAAAGVGVMFNNITPLLKRVNVEADMAVYRQMTGSLLPYDNGYGLYVKAEADVWRFRAHASYWKANDFISVLGNPLFGTVGVNDRSFTMRKPNLITAQISYAQELGHGFSWGAQASFYNHLPADAFSASQGAYRESNRLSIAAGVYLRVDPSFLLKKFK